MCNSRMKRCIFFALLFGLAACETMVDPYGRPIEAPLGMPGGEPAGGGGAFSLITPQQEIELGQQIAAEVERQQRRHPDPQLQAYVDGIGQRLVAGVTRQDIPYSFVVIDSPDINAFSLPGGRTYVYTGLMKLASNEAELAAVMAHEIAHLALRHHAATITRQYGFEILTGIILGQNADERSRLVADLIGAGVQARYSRDQESAADELGMQLLANAGYNPETMLTIFDKMRAAGQNRPNLPIFASHPTTNERLQRLQALLQTFPANVRADNPIFTERYQEQALSKI